MKKKIAILLAATILSTGAFAGCSNSTSESTEETLVTETELDDITDETIEVVASDSEEADTVAAILRLQFQRDMLATDDMETMAQALIANEAVTAVSMDTMEVTEGYLNGFEGDVVGFNDGVMFSPVIGTIPFVGYIFETDDPEALLESLNNQAKLNWNICTEADEAASAIEGNYVFFVMSPYTFD